MAKNVAIFTGASSGMGREFVKQINDARMFDEIWLIARRRDRLEELTASLRSPARILELDLRKEEDLDTYRNALAAEAPNVVLFVNAAGFGLFGEFTEMDVKAQTAMIDLNAKALTVMTYLTLPYMTKGAELYELGSLSAFQPVPYIAVYSATKAYVLSFTRAVGREVKPRGIRMMAVCPFWVKTEFFDHAVHDDTISYYAVFYTADYVVRRAIKDMKKGRDLSVPGKYAKAQMLLVKLLPHRLVMALWCKQQKKP